MCLVVGTVARARPPTGYRRPISPPLGLAICKPARYLRNHLLARHLWSCSSGQGRSTDGQLAATPRQQRSPHWVRRRGPATSNGHDRHGGLDGRDRLKPLRLRPSRPSCPSCPHCPCAIGGRASRAGHRIRVGTLESGCLMRRSPQLLWVAACTSPSHCGHVGRHPGMPPRMPTPSLWSWHS